jgi:predicted transcriptional regulator
MQYSGIPIGFRESDPPMARAAFHLLDVRSQGPQADGAAGSSRLPHMPRIKDREREAIRLRDKGWSYRRIAEALQVQYILVSRWLSGVDQPLVRSKGEDEETVDVSRAAAALSRDAASGLRALAARYDRLEERLDGIAQDMEAARAREDALARTVEDLKQAVANLSG